MKFKIPVWWMVSAEVEVEADSLDEAIAIVRKDPAKAGVPEHGDYIDESLSVDELLAEELAYDGV